MSTLASVLTKANFVDRYARGEFGNCSPTWGTLSEFLQSDYYEGPIHLRNRIIGGPTHYDIPPEEVQRKYNDLISKGVKPDDIYFSAMCPTPFTTLQGEVMQSERHIDLTYTKVPLPMRDAMRLETCHSFGIMALGLLKLHMDAPSYDWLQELLDLYPGHVVEFTCLSVCWGTVPNRNTLFWEVRRY